MVEKFGQHLQFHGQDAGMHPGGKRHNCAQFHAGMKN